MSRFDAMQHFIRVADLGSFAAAADQLGVARSVVTRRIAALEEVESIFLMSGGYDLCCLVTDKSFQEVSMFVASRLSPKEDVVSTATHFILKKYKEQGMLFAQKNTDDRGNISL